MRPVLFALLLLAGCRESDPATDIAHDERGPSPCESRTFEGDRFIVCSAVNHTIEVRTSGTNRVPSRNFAALENALGDRAQDVAFAMNAGMFDEEGRAIGLLIEDGEELRSINRRDGGGNFHMHPNGVFLVRRNGSPEVVATSEFEPSDDIAFASQSGPMLVIEGELHPSFQRDGQSRNIRNGVGVSSDGAALFAISTGLVSFGKFARFFRDELEARNALYFDGNVSSLWNPADHRRDAHALLGPMVVVFTRAQSEPDRENPARP